MKKLKILIAEDDEITQKIYDRGLSDDHFEKRMADNGRDALEIYNKWNPDVVILDIMMPEMTGYEALKQIRKGDSAKKNAGENEKQKRVAIIMATALRSEEDVRDCLKLGIAGYLVKPLNPYKLFSQVMDYYRKENPE